MYICAYSQVNNKGVVFQRFDIAEIGDSPQFLCVNEIAALYRNDTFKKE